MSAFFGTSLDDPRVSIVIADVGKVIRIERRIDAIPLDVDNGPQGLTRQSNDRLYEIEGLVATLKAWAPAGLLAVWSQGATLGNISQRLVVALQQAGNKLCLYATASTSKSTFLNQRTSSLSWMCRPTVELM
ncbi:hypothetical protein GCM10007874_59370 [Labrys miyagiensis]|uniref:Uncharacterized protein n=1 Tax=Labrys miyagiensis TaxID=346912 RepID=A0ABQ6CXC2_9HYPH|nr:hypothetical protein GCM10007874_59370 [Labrys miyagiensis]